MIKKFTGRLLIGGETQGECVVSRKGFNTLACFFESILADPAQAICSDADNADILGLNLTGKIVCLPQTIGSTSAGATWLRVCQLGLAPRALLFSKSIDTLAAAGLALIEAWTEYRFCAVDRLGKHFLQSVETGKYVKVRKDGTVIIL